MQMERFDGFPGTTTLGGAEAAGPAHRAGYWVANICYWERKKELHLIGVVLF